MNKKSPLDPYLQIGAWMGLFTIGLSVIGAVNLYYLWKR